MAITISAPLFDRFYLFVKVKSYLLLMKLKVENNGTVFVIECFIQ